MIFLPFAIGLSLLHPAPKAAYQHLYTLERVSLTMSGERPAFQRETETKEVRPGSKDQRTTVVSEEGTLIFELAGKTAIYERILPNGMKERKEVSVEQWGEAVLGGIKEQFGVTMEDFGKNGSSAYLNEYRTIAGIKCIKHHSRFRIGEYDVEQISWDPVDKKIRAILPQLEKHLYSVSGETRTLTSAETVISFTMAKQKK